MRSADALIVWTPNRETHAANPTRGKIRVFQFGQQDDPYYASSVGACDLNWNTTDDGGRLALMQRYVTVMLYEDDMELDAVREAITQIDEFRKFPFSIDAKSPDGGP